MSFDTIRWTDSGVVMIDQRKLPTQEIYITARTFEEVAEAIEKMVIRGAPAIGVAAAMGVARGALAIGAKSRHEFDVSMAGVCDRLAETRPTAVNLFWAIERMKRKAASMKEAPLDEVKEALVREAVRIHEEDIECCRRLGRHGAELIQSGATVLTHCNAGALATGGYGTALGVVRAAVEMGKSIRVIADETRPFLQGARLTAWELAHDGIEVTLITDNMAGHFMSRGRIDYVVVGADRIVANGDVANKIGTYSVSVLAKENEIPFYVAAPTSTVDLELKSGADIPIEERNTEEVTQLEGKKIAPEGVPALNPAFDVTPSRYVSAIITEEGVANDPYGPSLKKLVEAARGRKTDGG